MMKSHTVRLLLACALFMAFVAQQARGADSAGDSRREIATFAGGCFWCLEEALDKVDGVLSTTSGYTGGQKAGPTYEEVSAGGTGHTESVQVMYDPQKVNYAALLDVFWHNIDPTTPDQQFCDK